MAKLVFCCLIREIYTATTYRTISSSSLLRGNFHRAIHTSKMALLNAGSPFSITCTTYDPVQPSPSRMATLEDPLHAIGFDLDHTLIRYKLEPFMKMIYESIALHMVHDFGYDERLLQFDDDLMDFCFKGNFLDRNRGNFLKVADNGYIIRACHGSKLMSDDELATTYGKERIFPYFADVKDTYDYSNMCYFFDGYYEIPTSAIAARLIDFVDAKKERKAPYKIWGNIQNSVFKVFFYKNFKEHTCRFFKLLFAEPEKYAERCSDKLVNYLKSLKQRGKKLFIITYSTVETATLMLDYILGPDTWRELFDIVVVDAKKPAFFDPKKKAEHQCFINNDKDEKIPFNEKWSEHGVYIGGHFSRLLEFLSSSTGEENPKVMYFGDSIRSDIVGPKKFLNWTCGAIIDELGPVAFPDSQDESRKKVVSSKRWGSFFYDSPNCTSDSDDNLDSIRTCEWNTFWANGIKKYADFCIPSLQYFVDNPKSSIAEYPPHQWPNASS